MSSNSNKQPTLKKLARGLTVTSVMTGSTFFHGPPVLALGLTKLFKKSAKVDETNIKITNSWLGVNNWLIEHVLKNTQWQISVDESLDLNMQGRYLMTCNHQSWVDTTVNQYFGLTRMPDWVLGGNYEDDAEYRARFQKWIDQIWTEKDQLIAHMQQNFTQAPVGSVTE